VHERSDLLAQTVPGEMIGCQATVSFCQQVAIGILTQKQFICNKSGGWRSNDRSLDLQKNGIYAII
jgi:hypothetical protein